MAKTTEYRCPDCGGANVQDLCTVWVNCNTSEIADGEMHVAELYTDTRWCDDCQDHPKAYWVEVEVEVEPDTVIGGGNY